MTRSLAYLALAAALVNTPGTCSKQAANQSSVSARGGAAAAGGDWTSLGATACSTYLTPDVARALLADPPGTAKTLSRQSCSLGTGDGNISITLIADNAAGFDAFATNLVDPHPLSGVGDKALQHMIGIAAYKGPSKVCTIDVVGAPGFVKLSGAALGRALGAVCNKLFAATP